ncbi:MAG TPA: TonB-dependent receptor [Saprospiraceae bacterium]|nr:TonB-dependent receptor [Saprospiraceae bacterium]HQV96446.1 TonB-dependent receptor [Saprospiraceae bacterium]
MEYQMIKTEQKALDINLNDPIYGTFAEIGAGQEVARNFFQAGAAAGTIAKTMSAYDKTYSDAIYGVEPSGRYVSEPRLYKMLDHEWHLMEERLKESRPDATFFVFADTVQAINYTRTIKGNGWMGLRFRLVPDGPVNDMVLHVKMLDTNNRLQQEAIGILGVNMIYASFYYNDNPEKMVMSLVDNIKDRVSIDLLRINGQSFNYFDNRLVSLYLVKHKLTSVAMFDINSRSIHASEFLYRESLMVIRGNFRPPTIVTQDVIECSFNQFRDETTLSDDKLNLMMEMTMDYLKGDGADIDEKDFLERADMITALGHKVLLSDCANHEMLINYLSDYKISNLGLVIGVRELQSIITDKYTQNQDGRLLVAFGELFSQNIRIYVYPAQTAETDEIITAENMTVPEGIKFLYQYLLDSRQVVAVKKFNSDILHIYPTDVLSDIQENKTGWEQKVPESLVKLIKERQLFGYQ